MENLKNLVVDEEVLAMKLGENNVSIDIDNFEKDRLTNIGGKIGGPGYYKTDSYFDWNKKSYNILFN